MIAFSIDHIVRSVGESFTISGVTRSFNDRGDPTETYVAYSMSGVVQQMDGADEEVREGLLDTGDLIIFISDTMSGVSLIKNNDYAMVDTSVSGVFRIVNLIKNPGHYELQAKRLIDTTP